MIYKRGNEPRYISPLPGSVSILFGNLLLDTRRSGARWTIPNLALIHLF